MNILDNQKYNFVNGEQTYFEVSENQISETFLLESKYLSSKNNIFTDFSSADWKNKFVNWIGNIKESGGIILIGKEEGWTSFDVVWKVKNALRKKLFEQKIIEGKNFKVGHAGTLDPLASGLMIIAVGKGTKDLNNLQNLDKQYIGTIKLGVSTPSFDRETPEESEAVDISNISEKQILNTIPKFLGKIQQTPPIYSAIKIDGKRAYEFARKKIEKEIEPREVEISDFQITQIDFPFIKFKIDVSKGFYVRSFARDFGKELGLPSYLYSLTRTRVGSFFLDNAITIDDIRNSLIFLD